MAAPPLSQGPGSPDPEKQEQKRTWRPRWFRSRDDHSNSTPTSPTQPCPAATSPAPAGNANPAEESAEPVEPLRPSGLGKRMARRVVPGLPRPGTFKRQNSERREHLEPVSGSSVPERRALSVDRRLVMKIRRTTSPEAVASPKLSAPAVCSTDEIIEEALVTPLPPPRESREQPPPPLQPQSPQLLSHSRPPPQQEYTPVGTSDGIPDVEPNGHASPPPPPQPQQQQQQQQPQPQAQPAVRPAPPPSPPPDSQLAPLDTSLYDDIDERWILNLSMHFRDKSPREKFFVTYAETPTRWRRVTVSCDYRDAPPCSLEQDLQTLPYQRDKSERIYEALAASLPSIQFYDTVTNLRLQTSPDDRLHVHVTEDVNEIIKFPSSHAVRHLGPDVPLIPERDVHFVAHMSGFVYKVRASLPGEETVCVKKEIPGPDSVEEFLYEINALYALRHTPHVIHVRGLVTDDAGATITGLLIDYAAKGPLVDLIYDAKADAAIAALLPWSRRAKWTRQIVAGLAAIHEAGFVQGDFTLSNIVVDGNDDARIIDINRRGCPVGWEPPEFRGFLDSGQRIALYIGVKSDLFQLGMVLWALAKAEDEPERQPRPLTLEGVQDIPADICEIAQTCLYDDPALRVAAKELLGRFQTQPGEAPLAVPAARPVDPAAGSTSPKNLHDLAGIALDDDVRSCSPPGSPPRNGPHPRSPHASSLEIPFDDPGSSYFVRHRGRQPGQNTAHLNRSPKASSRSTRRQSLPRGENGVEGGRVGEGEAQEGEDEEYEDLSPQIVAVSPGGDHGGWSQFSYEGQSVLISRAMTDEVGAPQRRETEKAGREDGEAQQTEDGEFRQTEDRAAERTEDIDEDGDEEGRHVVRRKEGIERLSLDTPRAFTHIDSGIADMDPLVSAREDEGAKAGGPTRLERMVEERVRPVDEILGDSARGEDGHFQQVEPTRFRQPSPGVQQH